MPMDGQPTAFHIRQVNPAAQVRAEDAVLFDQIRDGVLPLVRPPAGHGDHKKAEHGNVQDRGSLHYRLSVTLETTSAVKWDTSSGCGPTGIKAMTEHVLEAYRADLETRLKDRELY